MLRLAIIIVAVLLTGCASLASSRALTAGEVAEALKAAGLPIANITVFDAESDPNKLLGRPNQYIGKANFRDSRLKASPAMSTEAGGSVEVFASQDDVKRRKEYLANMGKVTPLATEYDFDSGLVLLRLSKALTPEQATEYAKALKQVVK